MTERRSSIDHAGRLLRGRLAILREQEAACVAAERAIGGWEDDGGAIPPGELAARVVRAALAELLWQFPPDIAGE